MTATTDAAYWRRPTWDVVRQFLKDAREAPGYAEVTNLEPVVPRCACRVIAPSGSFKLPGALCPPRPLRDLMEVANPPRAPGPLSSRDGVAQLGSS